MTSNIVLGWYAKSLHQRGVPNGNCAGGCPVSIPTVISAKRIKGKFRVFSSFPIMLSNQQRPLVSQRSPIAMWRGRLVRFVERVQFSRSMSTILMKYLVESLVRCCWYCSQFAIGQTTQSALPQSSTWIRMRSTEWPWRCMPRHSIPNPAHHLDTSSFSNWSFGEYLFSRATHANVLRTQSSFDLPFST